MFYRKECWGDGELMDLQDSYTSPDQLINLMNEPNTIFLFEDLLLCFLGFFRFEYLSWKTIAFILYLCCYVALHKTSIPAFFFLFSFSCKSTVCLCVFSVFIFHISFPGFQNTSHAVMSLTTKAPNDFSSAESVGDRKTGGFRVNLHHHRK